MQVDVPLASTGGLSEGGSDVQKTREEQISLASDGEIMR